MTDFIAKARVKLTIDIPVSDSWGENCSLLQIKDQAIKSALGALKDPNNRFELINNATIIGQPEVITIFVLEKR